MGVKCSLLGHDYGDADVERERAERGDEVVRTAKRVERCRNCGHGRTVSENTEVTALEAAVGVVRKPDGTIIAATDGTNETSSDSFGSVSGDSSDERSASDGGVIVEELEESKKRERTEKLENAAVDTVTTDGNGGGDIDKIHDDRPGIHTNRPNRAPGEWPAEPEDEPPRAQRAGTQRENSAGIGSSGTVTVARAGANRWPDETDATTRAEPLNLRTTENESESGTSDAVTRKKRAEAAFACPSCGFSAAVTDSPLRAGDICPDCGHGYLAWETRKG